MSKEKRGNYEKNQNDTTDVSEDLEWDKHYATRKKAWRLNEETNDDVTLE